MKLFLIIAVILVSVLVPVYLVAWQHNRQILQSPQQTQFLAGHLPDPLPNGYYAGQIDQYTGTWRGKLFDRATSTGSNILAGTIQTGVPSETESTDVLNLLPDAQTIQKYAFVTSIGPRGLQLSYNQSSNPIWLRFITDEIVETAPKHYLGKMQLNLLPGLPVTITWFQLQQAD